MTGFLIAGSASGVGKTTVTLAIAAALRRRGYTVQPFKAGPDFLDTGHHTRIAGRTARNLDTWMLTAEANRAVFRDAATGADVLLAEGMMGLFDGKDGATDVGSSAEIARLLQLPVVLVVDAGRSARSVAAVVLGFEQFDPSLALAGVILNRVAGERHYDMLRQAIQSACRTPVFGWVPHDVAITIPERHLGLHTAEEAASGAALEATIDRFAAIAEKHLDLPALLQLQCGLPAPEAPPQRARNATDPVRIGIARDRAFSFYYEDNLDLLQQQGATLVPFSPLDDLRLPSGLDALYLGGGYPELYAQRLSSRSAMIDDVRHFAASGRPIYAECGGMIYLSKQLTTTGNGAVSAMAGVLPFSMQMTSSLVHFGYVTVTLTEDCMLGNAGAVLRGHSFHHSRIAEAPALPTCYQVLYSLSGQQECEGYSMGNVLASYIHLHFRTHPGIAPAFVEAARAHRPFALALTPAIHEEHL